MSRGLAAAVAPLTFPFLSFSSIDFRILINVIFVITAADFVPVFYCCGIITIIFIVIVSIDLQMLLLLFSVVIDTDGLFTSPVESPPLYFQSSC